jgi:tripartite-type tricarboxylate transporter receptor subunit TctC
LEEAFNKASQSPTFKEFAAQNLSYTKKIMLRDELSRFLGTERAKSGEIIQKLGLGKK